MAHAFLVLRLASGQIGANAGANSISNENFNRNGVEDQKRYACSSSLSKTS